jgi:hypothetical protein
MRGLIRVAASQGETDDVAAEMRINEYAAPARVDERARRNAMVSRPNMHVIVAVKDRDVIEHAEGRVLTETSGNVNAMAAKIHHAQARRLHRLFHDQAMTTAGTGCSTLEDPKIMPHATLRSAAE